MRLRLSLGLVSLGLLVSGGVFHLACHQRGEEIASPTAVESYPESDGRVTAMVPGPPTQAGPGTPGNAGAPTPGNAGPGGSPGNAGPPAPGNAGAPAPGTAGPGAPTNFGDLPPGSGPTPTPSPRPGGGTPTPGTGPTATPAPGGGGAITVTRVYRPTDMPKDFPGPDPISTIRLTAADVAPLVGLTVKRIILRLRAQTPDNTDVNEIFAFGRNDPDLGGFPQSVGLQAYVDVGTNSLSGENLGNVVGTSCSTGTLTFDSAETRTFPGTASAPYIGTFAPRRSVLGGSAEVLQIWEIVIHSPQSGQLLCWEIEVGYGPPGT